MAMKARTIERLIEIPSQRMTAGFSTHSLRQGMGLTMDPFLSIDEFLMSEATFPPHPHAGFSAVTYMLEDSQGAFTNRDSHGDHSRIEPGALHWTQAAHGMMHEEVPEIPGTMCHGLQIFVNLRSDHKREKPKAFHVGSKAVPEVHVAEANNPRARVRVLVGSFGERTAPLESLLTPVLLLDVQLEEGARLDIPLDPSHTAFALALKGKGQAQGKDIAAHAGIGFAKDGDLISFTGGVGGLHIVVGSGMPINEPVVFGGPFAMNTRSEIADAQERFRRGEMGRM
jgi:redox-sensitive bicupin YhaK (pirin superfamily)